MEIPHSRISNLELIDFPDCTNLTEYCKCKGLNFFRCEGKDCVFLKSIEQQEDSIKQVYRRLASLDETTQQKISDKCYNGKRPWMKNSYKEKSVLDDMEVKEHV